MSPTTGRLRRKPFSFLLAGFIVGCLLTGGIAVVAGMLTDDSRSGIALQDIVRENVPGFTGVDNSNNDACGDRRGCEEGIEGSGASLYRYSSLDLARQAVIYSTADFYRSDRLVIEFEENMTADERYRLIQVVEGTWTGSDD
ncbi:hypothetical protein [Rathayibacter sp. PhB127]|uniref:hypothetical protein n=1 Tax=Rathayibacter sp. PhB127 TaxID=2485176 RepID=UPI00161F594E|nr:hypothetical protein [Rathayibacter sp. PhB127]